MAKVRIITDVTAYLQPELPGKYPITFLPLEVRLGGSKFLFEPGDDPTPLLQHMVQGPAELAQITTPSNALQAALGHLCQEAEEILIIPSSSKLSDIYAKAQAMARSFLGRCRIMVVDSMSSSWGLALLVEAAARAADQGRSLDEIVRLVRGMLPHIYLVFLVERLDYLEKGGRIGVAQALLGTMLRIKPLLLMEGGEIIPMEKVRTLAMAVEKLADFVAEFASIQQVVILHSPLKNSLDDEIDNLRQMLGEILPNHHFPIIEYDPLLACHLGPEALGVAVYE